MMPPQPKFIRQQDDESVDLAVSVANARAHFGMDMTGWDEGGPEFAKLHKVGRETMSFSKVASAAGLASMPKYDPTPEWIWEQICNGCCVEIEFMHPTRGLKSVLIVDYRGPQFKVINAQLRSVSDAVEWLTWEDLSQFAAIKIRANFEKCHSLRVSLFMVNSAYDRCFG